MNIYLAACLAATIAALPTIAPAQLPQGAAGYGAYLADRFGSTCSGFVDAANTVDAVRLQLYASTIKRLAAQKWGAVAPDRLRRVLFEIVSHCEAHRRSDFESAANAVIARSGS
jgi:hypothetical protein